MSAGLLTKLQKQMISHGRKTKQKNSHGLTRNYTEIKHTQFIEQKGSNGGVAVGLPHRNSSVLKQAAPNKQKVKERDPPSAVVWA